MSLEPGLFAFYHAPDSPVAENGSGLPGVRISLPPGSSGADHVIIKTFHDDGWLTGRNDAALVRVVNGGAQVLVTVYQSANGNEPAPRLQVMQLSSDLPIPQTVTRTALVAPPAGATEVIAHVQRTGDVPGRLGAWVGVPGSKLWIEGFSLSPENTVPEETIEYQAVLGRGWLSPWVKGGEYCGSRGMALPILGLRARLVGAAAQQFVLSYSATFIDGSRAGPVEAEETCESENLAPLEAFQVQLVRHDAVEANEITAATEPEASRRGRQAASARARTDGATRPASREKTKATSTIAGRVRTAVTSGKRSR
jgi:hypothetical protein